MKGAELRPIVVTSGDAVVVDGHARMAAALQLGADEVPALVVSHPYLRTS